MNQILPVTNPSPNFPFPNSSPNFPFTNPQPNFPFTNQQPNFPFTSTNPLQIYPSLFTQSSSTFGNECSNCKILSEEIQRLTQELKCLKDLLKELYQMKEKMNSN